MPYRRRASFRRGPRPVINSVKNVTTHQENLVVTPLTTIIARAVDNPTTAVTIDCQRGSIIKAIWVSIDFCGLAGSGAIQRIKAYLMKDPGTNLTPPSPFTIGSSNEKKFIFKIWAYMSMRNQDGNPPYHWEGWVKIPKRYQRMGTDDRFLVVWEASTLTGHGTLDTIYKWYT